MNNKSTTKEEPENHTVNSDNISSDNSDTVGENSISDMKQFLAKMLHDIQAIGYVKPEEVPNIDLYMDQVTTFMDDKLQSSKRHESDKLLTKTMINNYTKNNLLPPPTKKKYSRDHVLTLIFIYYFKNILSINDIQTILSPLTKSCFGNKDGYNMEEIYNEVFNLEEEEMKKLLKDLGRKYQIANNTFNDFPEEDRDFLHKFSFICQLCYDVYLDKMIIEKMIDEMTAGQADHKEESVHKEPVKGSNAESAEPADS